MGKLILVTGGAGFIGSHTVVELLLAGHECVVIDNLKNANLECIKRQEQITGKKITYYQVDILDRSALDDVFSKHAFFAVIHFAGLKSVGESCTKPLEYYRTNVGGTITLLECMREHGVKNMVFSSSSTVYGLPQYLPLDEKHPIGGCPNPYGNTKLVVELMLKDLVCARPDWNVVCLRYFNPVGAHPSGLIGEDPLDVPNNLMPYISQVAVGRRPVLSIFGSDYNTKDGTGVRDYIHIVDLAIGHVAALKKLEENCGHKVYNLGTGMGLSVLDLVHAMEKASGKKIPYKLVDRRPGDIETNYADATLAFVEMGWKTERGVAEMCEDAWRFQNSNPFGYALSQASVKKIDGCEVSTRCQNGCMAHEEN